MGKLISNLFLFMLFFIGISLVNSVDNSYCQYTEIKSIQIEKSLFYFQDFPKDSIGEALTFDSFTSENTRATMRVYNHLNQNVVVNLSLKLQWYYKHPYNPGETKSEIILKTVEIPYNSYISVDVTSSTGYTYSSNFNIINDSITYVAYIDEDKLIYRNAFISENLTVCKSCNGVQCLNDGDSCVNNFQCGGNYCVNNYCSNTNKCFENNCKCTIDEVQCNTNDKCVKVNSIAEGFKPICSELECQSKYVDNQTTLCAINPVILQKKQEEEAKLNAEKQQQIELQKQQEQLNLEKQKNHNNLIYLIIIAIIIISLSVLYYNYKVTESKNKKIEEKKIFELENLINKISERIEKLNKNKNINIKEVINLKKEKEELIEIKTEPVKDVVSVNILKTNKDLKSIEKINIEIAKRISTLGCVYISGEKYIENPNNNSRRLIFAKKTNGKEFHRWLYFSTYPNTNPEYEIHHIDGNNKNNFLCNLIALKSSHHHELHKIYIEKFHMNYNQAFEELIKTYKHDYPENHFDNVINKNRTSIKSNMKESDFNISKENKKKIKQQENFKKVKEKYPHSFERWTEKEEEILKELYNKNKFKYTEEENIAEIAKTLQRGNEGIKLRLQKLNLIK